nr:8230_t:CDS:2 [Entrophospora candida]
MVVKINIQEINNHHLFETFNTIKQSKKCVVITGAGISCSGGVPDFRSAGGIYDMIKQRFPGSFRTGKDLFDTTMLKDHKSIGAFNMFMGILKERINNARPTPTHHFLKKLDDKKKLVRVYTQNIDNLEEVAGLATDSIVIKPSNCTTKAIQLHGTMKFLKCSACSEVYEFSKSHCERFKEGESPSCPRCEQSEQKRRSAGKRSHKIGILKPNIVLYGDNHSQELQIGKVALKDSNKADCMIIMGTSLQIPGIKDLIRQFAVNIHKKGGKIIVVNLTDIVKTKEMFDMVDYFVQGTTDEWVSMLEEELNEPKAVNNKRKLREIENINIIDFTKSKQQKTADSNDNTDIKRKTSYTYYYNELQPEDIEDNLINDNKLSGLSLVADQLKKLKDDDEVNFQERAVVMEAAPTPKLDDNKLNEGKSGDIDVFSPYGTISKSDQLYISWNTTNAKVKNPSKDTVIITIWLKGISSDLMIQTHKWYTGSIEFVPITAIAPDGKTKYYAKLVLVQMSVGGGILQGTSPYFTFSSEHHSTTESSPSITDHIINLAETTAEISETPTTTSTISSK